MFRVASLSWAVVVVLDLSEFLSITDDFPVRQGLGISQGRVAAFRCISLGRSVQSVESLHCFCVVELLSSLVLKKSPDFFRSPLFVWFRILRFLGWLSRSQRVFSFCEGTRSGELATWLGSLRGPAKKKAGDGFTVLGVFSSFFSFLVLLVFTGVCKKTTVVC